MKPNIQPSDSTGLSTLFQYPPRINFSSPVLGSIIDLRTNPLIACSVFTTVHSTTPNEQLSVVEIARKRIVSDYALHPIIDSLLPSVYVAKDRVSLYVFATGSTTEASTSQVVLSSLELEGLEQSETYHIIPEGIYPCSPTCAAQLLPCPACLQQVEATSPSASSQASSSTQNLPSGILPRLPLRIPFSQFMQAVRDRIIDDITRSSTSLGDVSARATYRLQGGILLSPLSIAESSEWGAGWDHFSRSRPYVHCQLQIHLSRTQILVHPILRSTPYFALSKTLPLPAGTAIVLLPHGVPAYFLNIYSGPVGGLTRQFEDALLGLGCSNWKSFGSSYMHKASAATSPTYIIAWVSVQNKQGEEKGLPIIWPMALAVLPDNTSQSRQRLTHMPDLPPQLLASPPAIPAQAPPIRFPISTLNPPTKLSATPAPHDERLSSPQSAGSQDEQPRDDAMKSLRPSLTRSPTSDSLRAFRSLIIGRKNTPSVARDVSMFVASVAQEREREWERFRRGRDASSSRIYSSPAKQEIDSAHSSPAVARQEQDVKSSVPQVLSMPSPVGDQTLPKLEDKGGSLPAWNSSQATISAEHGEFLPAVDIASPAGAVKMEISSDVLPEPGSLSSSDTNMAVDASTAAFDSFSGFDPSWNQSGNEFMNIDASLDNYNFDMGMDMAGGNDNETNNLGHDDGFGLFTDDDFNFFDAPQSAVRTSAPGLLPISSVTMPNPPHNLQTSGPGPPSYPAHAIPATWVTQFAIEGLTPRSMAASTPGVAPPELMPSTPAQTPPSQSGPTTPVVLLADHDIHIRRSSTSSQGSGFDPIPFGPTHKATDDKYVLGKFALPTSALDEVERIQQTARRPDELTSLPDWKFSYGSVTDPRIGVVRRLVGIKRKRLGKEQRVRGGRVSPAWLHEHEEWASCSTQSQEEHDTDSWSDSDVDIDDEGPEAEDRSSLSLPRPYTPVPYLPLGPTLVQTGFYHPYLLPLSGALRPPGSVLSGTTGPMSVPTPVSPAAALGAASERTKALEAVAQLLVQEVVENPIWADAWHASLAAKHALISSAADVWPADIRYASRIFSLTGGLRAASGLKEVYQSDGSIDSPPFREFDQPMLSVGKSDALIHVLPAALRFWTKLGLTPRGGSKDVTAFVFFEGVSDAREEQVASWLESASHTYQVKNFGRQTPGCAVGCTRDGLIPVQFDAFKKTLMSFIAGLPDVASSMVFYIVIPLHAVNLTSQLLRQIFSAIRKAKKTYADASLLFHLIPEPFLNGNMDDPTMRHRGFEVLADAVYDRIPVAVTRSTARTLTPDAPRMQALFQEPAFTLARPLSRKATFRLEARPTSLDVMDRSSILHVGYHWSTCGKWLLAACVDQRGETHELKAWLIPSDGVEAFVVSNVWALALHVAAKANVEWRIVIAKLGFMDEAEVEAWSNQLRVVNEELPPSQVFLVVVDPNRPWNFLIPDHVGTQKTPRSPNRVNKNSIGTVFHEASTSTYLIHIGPKSSLLLDAPPAIVPSHPYIPDVEEDTAPSTCIIRPISSVALVQVPTGTDYTSISTVHLHLLHSTRVSSTLPVSSERAILDDIAQNYHDLALLTKYRWKLKTSPSLPFHLAALEVMGTALTSNESFTD